MKNLKLMDGQFFAFGKKRSEKKLNDVLTILNKWLRRKNYRLYVDLADCYVRQNKKEEAIKALEAFQTQEIHSSAVNEMLENLRK